MTFNMYTPSPRVAIVDERQQCVKSVRVTGGEIALETSSEDMPGDDHVCQRAVRPASA